MRWVTFGILGAVLLYAVYQAGMIPNFGKSCDEAILKEVPSPDGRYTAAVVEQICKAGDQTHRARGVAIFETDDGYLGDVYETAAYITTFTNPIQLVWQTNDTILIDPQGTDMPVQRKTSWNAIRIFYAP